MKPGSIFLIFMISICFLGCENKESDFIWAYITETQCANAWDNIGLNTTEDNVSEYLDRNNILIFDFKIEVYSNGPFCNACTCVSGRNIEVLIETKNLEHLKKLGFTDN